MLGFATVDLSIQDNTLTVWLTSGQGTADESGDPSRRSGAEVCP
jgi:hypothetical protein